MVGARSRARRGGQLHVRQEHGGCLVFVCLSDSELEGVVVASLVGGAATEEVDAA